MPLAANQLLKYNGTKWTNANSNLSEQADVQITTPSNNQVIQYNGSKWVNASISGGGISYLGTWNATTNTPTITSGTGTAGQYYRVSVSGTTTIDGNSYWRYSDLIMFNGTAWDRFSTPSDIMNTFLPTITYSNYNFEALKRYIEDISYGSRYNLPSVVSYTATVTNVLRGLLYNYKIGNIIGVLSGNACLITDITPPTNTNIAIGGVVITNGYAGGAYHTTLGRYYLAPWGQSSSTSWHYYLDTVESASSLQTYTVTALGVKAYRGAVYSPTLQRVYFIPHNQATQISWHYIDTSGNLTAYTHGASSLVTEAYSGGVYSPLQNRIYMMPYSQCTSSTWHYINAATGTVSSYTGVALAQYAYNGGVYSPTQNRIYLVPYTHKPHKHSGII